MRAAASGDLEATQAAAAGLGTLKGVVGANGATPLQCGVRNACASWLPGTISGCQRLESASGPVPADATVIGALALKVGFLVAFALGCVRSVTMLFVLGMPLHAAHARRRRDGGGAAAALPCAAARRG